MNELHLGALICIVAVAILATGIPVAFGLGIVALIFLIAIDGWSSLNFLAETLFGGLDDFTLVSIPMFVIMGAAVASSPAGRDLYEVLNRWLNRVPGSLVIQYRRLRAVFRPYRFIAGNLCCHRQDGHPRDAQARLCR